jgi:hypothetical protein
MSTTVSPPEAQESVVPEPFEPPKVGCGDIVAYMKDGQAAMPAQVIEMIGPVVDLTIYNGAEAVRGIRHEDDPFLISHPHQRAENGTWRLSTHTLRLNAMEANFDSLLEDIKVVKTCRAEFAAVIDHARALEEAVETLAELKSKVNGLQRRMTKTEKAIGKTQQVTDG